MPSPVFRADVPHVSQARARGWFRAGAAALVLALSGAAAADDSKIALQGQGPRRETLSAMQYKPFDASLWGGLTGWSNGKAITLETSGKPILIVSWATWFKGSYEVLGDAQAAAEKFGHMGLEVVAVHHTRGFDSAGKVLKAGNHSVRVAHDQSGAFFKALGIEGAGPDYYFVDRAGNLRFAQVERGSVNAAAELLVQETAAQAAQAKAPAPTSGGGGGVGGGAWNQPDQAAYSSASWPATNRVVEAARNVQGRKLPVALGQETWVGDKPDMNGRVIVLDFWATWCGPCIAVSPLLDELQTKHKEDLVIIGMSGQRRPGRPEDVAAIKSFLNKKPSKYYHANDLKQNVYSSLEIRGIPHVVVLSSDGVVRWQGNPHEPEFRKAVVGVINADPGVKARKG